MGGEAGWYALSQFSPQSPLAMPRPHDLCARIQNAFRARRAQVAVPHTVQNLGILNVLLRAGFINSITRGTLSAADPVAWQTAPESRRMIWADLKYREDRPVLTNMELISKPSKRIFMDTTEIQRLCTGRRAQWVIKPLDMGEVAVVKTRSKLHQFVEIREALRLKLGGEVLCRAR